MTAEQGGEGSSGGASPALYALRLEQLGQFAYALQAPGEVPDGPMPPMLDGRPRWSGADIFAFGRYRDFDLAVRVIDEDVAEVVRRVPKVGEVYGGLPFSDDERRWIWDLWENGFYSQPGDFQAMTKARISIVAPATDYQIIATGDRQGRDARDLVRRWAAWRRGADEFTDRSTYHKAMSALLDIGVELCPDGYDRDYVIRPLWWDYKRPDEWGAGPSQRDES